MLNTETCLYGKQILAASHLLCRERGGLALNVCPGLRTVGTAYGDAAKAPER